MLKYIISLSIALLSSIPAYAAYKCESPEGKVTYQEVPCQGGRESRLGGEVTSPAKKLISTRDRASFLPKSQEELQALVRTALKDPESATFKELNYVDGRALCGQVNAKNSYGGYTGFRRFVADYEGIYWSGDGSAQIDIGRVEARRTFVPKSHFWAC